ncbi:microtubule-associated protein 10 isoform X1 [Lepisosteus oculatus]|uniref:microtubule-associated protein 10 isoform X1 n=2 Tax=Lepisosteus oculatus TaxID=7918 RepID=UPI0035F50D53
MANKSDKLETLFSFEVLVEYVNLDRVSQGSVDPAVAIRLLDFPTLMIYPGGREEDAQQDDDSGSEKENEASQFLHPPRGRNREYRFNKGKSCLFKIRLDSLHTHLSNTPLYAMVLDLTKEAPKLVGSSLISLAKTADRVMADVRQHGICTPSAQGEKGVFAVSNLMGDRVGCISLGFKLLSLGASLIPHIPENRILKTGSCQVKDHTVTPSGDLETGADSIQVTLPVAPGDSSSVLLQKMELEGQHTQVIISEPDAKQRNVTSAGTQTDFVKRRQIETQRKNVGLDNATDTAVFCPPPLYYRCSVKEQDEVDADRYRSVRVGIEALGVEELCSEEDECAEERDLPAKGQALKHTKDGSERSGAAQQSQTALGDTLRQLPLLNALLLELSLLSSQPQLPPLPVHPRLAWLYRSAEEQSHGAVQEMRSGSPAYTSSTSQTPVRKRSTSPGLKQWKLQAKTTGSLPISPKENGKTLKTNASHEKDRKKVPSPVPKRKLMYGLTNTLRLRLQKTNPDMLINHERRERYRRKQIELMKCKNKKSGRMKSRQAQERQNHTPRAAEIRDAGNSLDGNVETLINSLDLESPRVENPVTQHRRKQQSSSPVITKFHLRSSNHPARETVSNAVPKRGKKPGLVSSESSVHVHIPNVLSQDPDHSGDETGFPEPNATSPGFPSSSSDGNMSPGSSRFSSPGREYSDDFIDSPEPLEYVEDFSGPEPSDCHSAELKNGSEPALAAPREDCSDEGSSSNSSSFGSQRAAVPLPIRANSSPKLSLKGTRVTRPRQGTPAITESTEDSEHVSVDSKQPGDDRGTPRSLNIVAKETFDSQTLPGSGRQYGSFEGSYCISDSLGSPVGTNDTDLEFIGHEVASRELHEEEEARDELGSLDFENKYHHISELVVNKLPGYTL